MRRNLGWMTLMACWLLLGGLPTAEAQPGEREGRFDRMDQNSDGVVTAEEFGGPAERFARLDADGDGKLTREEMRSSFQRQRGEGWDPGRWRDMMNERMKETLGASDEEWAVLQPKIEKINELRMPMATGMMFGGFGMRGRGGDGDGNRGPRAGFGGEPAPEAAALQEALDNQNTSAESLQEKLDAFRKAAADREAKLKEAREELRELVTPRQEALLVLNGTLD